MSISPIMSAKDLKKTFGSGHTKVEAVQNASLDIFPGELVLITGPSGSGKTTLISMLGALLSPSSGQIMIDGVDVTATAKSDLPLVRARKIGFVFQSFNLLEALSARDNILLPAHLAPGGIDAAAARADELIGKLGLQHRSDAMPATLSGGEKQRVAIARAMINEPPLILADEPTGNLDSQSGQDVMMVLHDVARDEGRSVLMVTHDPRVEDLADRIFWLEDGVLRDRHDEIHDWQHCPVCNMKVDAKTTLWKYKYEGQNHVFCSERCLQRFEQSPVSYPS